MSSSKPSQEELFNKEAAVKSGAIWFVWIAILSIINSVIVTMNGNLNFIIGLGITQIVDALSIYHEPGSLNLDKTTGLSINLLIISMFFLIAYNAKRKKAWAFVIGMILYGLDGLIFLHKDYLSFGFHLFALFFIFKGFSAMRELNKITVPLIEINSLSHQSNFTGITSVTAKESKPVIICPGCKTELTENINYCTNCGMRISR